MKICVIVMLFGACALAQATGGSDVPENLRPPAGEKLLFQTHGAGDQIYVCKQAGDSFGWVLKAPDARLLSKGQEVGRHFVGPTWEWNDKSAVVGKVAATAPGSSADDIPWLMLNVIHHEGSGAMDSVTSVQRLHTKGGKAGPEACDGAHAGQEQRVHYEADYLFYGK